MRILERDMETARDGCAIDFLHQLGELILPLEYAGIAFADLNACFGTPLGVCPESILVGSLPPMALLDPSRLIAPRDRLRSHFRQPWRLGGASFQN